MIDRYLPPRIRDIWSDERRFRLWLRIEILACEAWAEIGRIPAEALPAIRQASFDLERIREIEARVGHDVIAFLTAAGETIGPESRYVHLGLTSSDVVDTALAVQLVESGGVILEDLAAVRATAAELARRHRGTYMVGRTHGIHAEPITFGFKVAGWVGELDRAIARLAAARDEIAVGKISGAVGTHATVDPRVEESVCAALGLRPDPASTQVIARDRHASFVSALALAASGMERIATEIRHLQRTEVGEVFEPFGRDQKGSSAMPHKRNPVNCERIAGLARVVRGHALAAMENVALWHERDISHSSAERVILPDAAALVDFMALQLNSVLGGLEVDPARMLANLNQGGGVVYSQRVLLALVDAGMSREGAYAVVQRAAFAATAGEGSFRGLLEADPEVARRLEPAALEAAFDPATGLRHTDLALERLGLLAPTGAGA